MIIAANTDVSRSVIFFHYQIFIFGLEITGPTSQQAYLLGVRMATFYPHTLGWLSLGGGESDSDVGGIRNGRSAFTYISYRQLPK